MTTPQEQLQELGLLLRQRQASEVESPATAAHRRAEFMKATVRERRVSPRTLWAFAAAAALLAFVTLRWLPDAPLHYSHAEGTVGQIGALLKTPASEQEALSFSDGTTVLLRESTTASVVETSSRGALIRLSRGKTAVSVVPRENAQWSFHAGPYVVEVKGTRFDLGWDPRAGHFSIEMSDGKVLVTGPNLESPRTLIAGQRLDLRRNGNSLSTDDDQRIDGQKIDDGTAGSSRPAAIPSSATVLEQSLVTFTNKRLSARPSLDDASTPNTPTATPSTWQALADKGQFTDALQRAKESNLETTLQSAPEAELSRLGDVARYAGDGLLATRTYKTLRKRFPETRAAAEAAFYLGRLVAPHRSAVRWFRTYLEAQPQGRLSQEAWGRRIEIHHRNGENKAAVAAAHHYLRTYPAGPHAALARRLISP